MNKIIICILLLASVSSAQVKQFIWKVGADGKAIPYYQNGKNINLDSAGVYSKAQVDSLIDSNTPDTAAYIASHHFVDSSSALRVKYSDTSGYVASHHYVDSVSCLKVKYADTISNIITSHKLDSAARLAEPSLGLPSANAMTLNSTTAGIRSWVADTVYMILVAHQSGSTSAIRYTTFGSGAINLAADNAQLVFPIPVTIDRMYVNNTYAHANAVASGSITVAKNRQATSLTCGFVNNGITSDIVHSVSFNAGETCSIAINPSTGVVDNITISVRARVK